MAPYAGLAFGTMSVCSIGSAAGTRVVGSPSSRRTMLAPWAIDEVLKNAMSRLPPWRPKPQSLETMSCSGAMCSSACRIRAAPPPAGRPAACGG
jgi:hypothetical protein